MKTLTQCISGLLVLTIIGLYCPSASFCAGSGLFANVDKKTITRHEPKIMSAPEMDIPREKDEPVEKKGPNWLMIGLGGVVVLGLAAAIGGMGGGGGDSGDGGENGENTGTITVGW